MSLIQGVAGDRNALGYLGFAYFKENEASSKLAVDASDGCAIPTAQSILDGTYVPLSRSLYIYVKKTPLQRPEVQAFIEVYLENAGSLVAEVGYVPLTEAMYLDALQEIKQVYTRTM